MGRLLPETSIQWAFALVAALCAHAGFVVSNLLARAIEFDRNRLFCEYIN
jgi:hypothetical protein